MSDVMAWCGQSIQPMSLERIREVRKEIIEELRGTEGRRDPFFTINEYRHRLRMALQLCMRVEAQRIRERAEGMCM